MSSHLKSKVFNLYKNLLYYGKEYPAGFDYFRVRLKKAFLKNALLRDENEIEKKLAQGEFVIKELDAMYKLKKYRFLKKSYYDTEEEERQLNLEKHLKSLQ